MKEHKLNQISKKISKKRGGKKLYLQKLIREKNYLEVKLQLVNEQISKFIKSQEQIQPDPVNKAETNNFQSELRKKFDDLLAYAHAVLELKKSS